MRPSGIRDRENRIHDLMHFPTKAMKSAKHMKNMESKLKCIVDRARARLGRQRLC